MAHLPHDPTKQTPQFRHGASDACYGVSELWLLREALSKLKDRATASLRQSSGPVRFEVAEGDSSDCRDGDAGIAGNAVAAATAAETKRECIALARRLYVDHPLARMIMSPYDLGSSALLAQVAPTYLLVCPDKLFPALAEPRLYRMIQFISFVMGLRPMVTSADSVFSAVMLGPAAAAPMAEEAQPSHDSNKRAACEASEGKGVTRLIDVLRRCLSRQPSPPPPASAALPAALPAVVEPAVEPMVEQTKEEPVVVEVEPPKAASKRTSPLEPVRQFGPLPPIPCQQPEQPERLYPSLDLLTPSYPVAFDGSEVSMPTLWPTAEPVTAVATASEGMGLAAINPLEQPLQPLEQPPLESIAPSAPPLAEIYASETDGLTISGESQGLASAVESYLWQQATLSDLARYFGVDQRVFYEYSSVDGESLLMLAVRMDCPRQAALLLRLCPRLIGRLDTWNRSLLQYLTSIRAPERLARAIASQLLATAPALLATHPLAGESASDQREEAKHSLLSLYIHDIIFNDGAGIALLRREGYSDVLVLSLIRQKLVEECASAWGVHAGDAFEKVCYFIHRHAPRSR